LPQPPVQWRLPLAWPLLREQARVWPQQAQRLVFLQQPQPVRLVFRRKRPSRRQIKDLRPRIL